MNSSHVATGTIIGPLATVLAYLSHWPLLPLDLPTAPSFAGLFAATAYGRGASSTNRGLQLSRHPVAPAVLVTSANALCQPSIAV